MKCYARISAQLAAILLMTPAVLAQTMGSGTATTSAPIGATATGQTVTIPTNAPGTVTTAPTTGAPGQVPTTGTPAPTQSIPKTWSTMGLEEALSETLGGTVTEPKTKAHSKKKAKKSKHTLTDEQVKELRSQIAADEKDIKSRMRLAEHFEAQGERGQMLEVLRPAFENLPRRGLLLLAKGYRSQKSYLNEVRVLETMLAQKEKDHIAHYLLGDAYLALDKRDEALSHYTEAKKIKPKFMLPYEALLRENKRRGYLHDSIQTVQDMITTFGAKARFYNELCLLYGHQAFLDKSAEVCRTAISKDPKHAPNHVILGLVIRDKDGIDASEKVLKQAAQQFQSSEMAQWAAGEISWEKKNYPASHRYFQQAVKNDPKSARSQVGLARAAFELQQYEEALNAYVESCKLDRSLIPAFRKATATLRQRNDYRWSDRFDGGLGKCGIY